MGPELSITSISSTKKKQISSSSLLYWKAIPWHSLRHYYSTYGKDYYLIQTAFKEFDDGEFDDEETS